MRSVRRTRTRDEERVAAILDGLGLSYAWGTTRLPGTPDFVLARRRTAVFVHGCFWHGHSGCRRARLPRTRRAFWTAKIARNRTRDRAVVRDLRRVGWRVVTLWGCRLAPSARVRAALRRALRSTTTLSIRGASAPRA